MELDAPLDVEPCGRALPDRPVQLLQLKPGGDHSTQKVCPGHFARVGIACKVIEECLHNLEFG